MDGDTARGKYLHLHEPRTSAHVARYLKSRTTTLFEHFTSDESEDNRIERASLRACVLACVRASRPTTIYDSSHATILASAIFSARCRTEWLHMVAIMGLEIFFVADRRIRRNFGK